MAGFRVDLEDSIAADHKDTTISLETKIEQKGVGHKHVCATLAVASDGQAWQGSWCISAAGLRRLARAAMCMADEVDATELMLAKLATEKQP